MGSWSSSGLSVRWIITNDQHPFVINALRGEIREEFSIRSHWALACQENNCSAWVNWRSRKDKSGIRAERLMRRYTRPCEEVNSNAHEASSNRRTLYPNTAARRRFHAFREDGFCLYFGLGDNDFRFWGFVQAFPGQGCRAQHARIVSKSGFDDFAMIVHDRKAIALRVLADDRHE